MLWLWIVPLGTILALLYFFFAVWKREGMTQAILNLISMVSFYFAFFYPLNSA
jgi:hypothetical protein